MNWYIVWYRNQTFRRSNVGFSRTTKAYVGESRCLCRVCACFDDIRSLEQIDLSGNIIHMCLNICVYFECFS